MIYKELLEVIPMQSDITHLSKRESRALIFQLLYTADAFDYLASLESIVDNYQRGFEFNIPFDSDIIQSVQAIIANRDQLDEYYKPLLSNWRFDRLGCATKLVLRFAVWELLYTQTNPTIIINEAIELAKCFAEKDSYKFINGILDEAVKKSGRKMEESVIES